MRCIELLSNQKKEYDNEVLLPTNFKEVKEFHESMNEYAVTPLHSLANLAESLGIKGIYIKDESFRFGLNAFKGLGASYAMHEIICGMKKSKNDSNASSSAGTEKPLDMTFVSCTDGNHGRALAWRAKQLGHKAVIFMPKGSELRRIKAIESFDAEVIVTQMNYDDTVRHARDYAEKIGAYLVQDTALPGYTKEPMDIVMGYSTMAQEALCQIPEKPTHVFLQAGVGSMAGGVLWYLYNQYGDDMPFVGIIEPESVACIYESAKANQWVSIGGEPFTLMAGLNCGEPNITTLPLLLAQSDCFIKCKDEVTLRGMELAQHPVNADPKFSSGESGAVGLGMLEMLIKEEANGQMLKLDQHSVVLLFSTEGVL